MWMLTYLSNPTKSEQIAFETLDLLFKYVESKKIKDFRVNWYVKG